MNNNKDLTNVDNAGNKYMCEICHYQASNNSNLYLHFKTKKHLKRIDNLNDFQKTLNNFYEEITTYIDQNINLVDGHLYDLSKGQLKDKMTNSISFVSKTLDEKQYLCISCNKYFNEQRQYLLHEKSCLSITSKYQTLKDFSIDVLIKFKKIIDTIKTNLPNACIKLNQNVTPTQKHTLHHVSDIKLKEKMKALKRELKIKSQEIENLKSENDTLRNQNKKIKKQHKLTQKAHLHLINTIETKNNNIINTNSNNTINQKNICNSFNFYFSPPPLDYSNVFINHDDPDQYIYDGCEEQKDIILKDNAHVSSDIQKMLCNSITFINKYRSHDLETYVSSKILKTYKKADPSIQSIWNTDINRLSYWLRTHGKSKDYWFKDKKAEELKSRILKPISNYIYEATEFYAQYLIQKHFLNEKSFLYNAKMSQKINEFHKNFLNGTILITGDQKVKIYNALMNIFGIQEFIKEDKFYVKILKEISPAFQWNKERYDNIATKSNNNDNANQITYVNEHNENKSHLQIINDDDSYGNIDGASNNINGDGDDDDDSSINDSVDDSVDNSVGDSSINDSIDDSSINDSVNDIIDDNNTNNAYSDDGNNKKFITINTTDGFYEHIGQYAEQDRGQVFRIKEFCKKKSYAKPINY